MKFYYLLALFFCLIICSCKSAKREDIKVGMTYDEVEKILGKPMNLDRAANTLENSYEYFDSLEIKNEITDSKYWGYPRKINTIGQLLYVCWIYDDIKTDTMYIYRKNYKTIEQVKKIIKQKEYYINDIKVNRFEYDRVDKFVYRDHKGGIIDKPLYNAYLKSSNNKPQPDMPQPERAIKKIIEIPGYITVKSNIPETPIKINYEMKMKYCVLFDASSGRVTQSGYFPFEILKLN